MNYNNIDFVKSAAKPEDIIAGSLPQIIFTGKSNVGKSSLINCILGRRQLARVSSSPGKTIHINYFLVDNRAYFIDLPGYGYAKVPRSERKRWEVLMESFFSLTGNISLAVMIVDARHKPTGDDVTMAALLASKACPFIIAANKTDKVKKTDIETNMGIIRETLEVPDYTQIIQFSAVKNTGREELRGYIERHI